MSKLGIFLLHSIYWLFYLTVVSSMVPILSDSAYRSHLIIDKVIFFDPSGVSMIVSAAIAFYLSYFFLFKKYYAKGNLFVVAGILTLIAVFASLVTGLVIYLAFGSVIQIAEAIRVHIIVEYLIIGAIFSAVQSIMGLILRGFEKGRADSKEKTELAKKNQEMELALIKAQINPHFLFNTINNIDVLIKKDADRASKYLNKLSDIMRFMLYEAGTEKVELKNELMYIENYVDLQKIRTSNHSYANYKVSGDAGKLLVEPMIFIPFIENAFKHAENKQVENAIDIEVAIEKDKINFSCQNTYSPNAKPKPEHSGLGNELIVRRLELLYPKRHVFKTTDKNGVYKVALSLSV